MSGKKVIQILDEKESIIETIDITKEKLDSFEKLKNIISSKINIKNKKVQYYIVDDSGKRNLIDSNNNYKNYRNVQLFKVKVTDHDNNTDDLIPGIFDLNSNINKELIKDIKESLECWFCLKDMPITNYCFCPNTKCLKGIHEECLKMIGGDNTQLRCICGNIYSVKDYKPNKLVNKLIEYTGKSNKDNYDKINYLENKLKVYELTSKKCGKHPNDYLVHFCYDCKTELCGTCLFNEYNNHKNHRLINLNAYNNIKPLLQKYNNKNMIIDNMIQKCRKNIELITKNKMDCLKILQEIYDDIKLKFDNFIEETNNLIEKIKIEYKDILNFKEKQTKFFDTLDRNKCNELKNIDEIKNGLFISEKNNESENELINEINSIELKNNNILKNFKKIIEYKDIFRTKIKIYNNGNRYEGEYKNNSREGKGICYYNNGDRYEGEFKNDISEGKGIYYFKDGDKFEGEYKKGIPEGKGVYYYKNGDKFEGKYKNNCREGNGVYYYKNGNIEIGSFKNDKHIGQHYIIFPDGSVLVNKY